MNVQEIQEYWKQFGDKEEVDYDNMPDEQKVYWVLARKIFDTRTLLVLFLFSEADYDVDETKKLSNRLEKLNDLACYLNIKLDISQAFNLISNLGY